VHVPNGINGLIWNFKPSNAIIIAKPAGGVVRDEEVVGSNPAHPT
jgi:hypothetical protein